MSKKPSILDALKPQRFRKIPPMTIEGFFRQLRHRIPADEFSHLSLQLSPKQDVDGGGWRATAGHCVAYGDTVPETIRAAFDHVTGYRPRRARFNPPNAFNPGGYRISYDYRAADWQPPKDTK